ncbi:MAG: tyrosine-type recombinase/integrase [Pyrinomonadaceae bacterium]
MKSKLVKITGDVPSVGLQRRPLHLTRREYLDRIHEIGAKDPVREYLLTLHSYAGRLSMLANLDRVALLLGQPSFQSLRWETIRYEHVTRIISLMSEKKYAPQTINATRAAIRGVAKACFILGMMKTGPYTKLMLAKPVVGENVPPGRSLPIKELSRLLDSCDEDRNSALGARDAAAIALMAAGGLRRGEAVSLKLKHFDRATHTVRVMGKGAKERFIYFGPGGARRALLNWLKRRGGDGDDAILCPINKGGSITPGRHLTGDALCRALYSRARKAGVEKFSPHDLRRTFATTLLEGGVDVFVVQSLLGHAKLETTRDYDRRREDFREDVLRQLRKFPYRTRRKLAGGRKRRGRRRRRRS